MAKLTDRILKLKEQSKNAEVWIDPERAQIVTRFYSKNAGKYSIPVLRARSFKNLMEKKELYLGDDELIVGERGRAPKLIPTFPEIASHSVEDLKVLDAQDPIPYHVSPKTMDIYEKEVIPYWEGSALRDKMFNQLSDEWQTIYNCGLITETMEQRAPGSMALDERMFGMGLKKAKQEIEEAIENLDFLTDFQATDKREQLTAMAITCDGMMIYAKRYADMLENKAARETDPARKKELEKMADVCRRVPENKPRDLWEVLQMSWFMHVGVITESNGWDACNAGHIDRHFYPYYQKSLEAGLLDQESAKELLSAWWIKYNNHPAPAKYGVSALESGTYNDFVNISLGGITKDGKDAVNDLSYIFLEILDEIEFIQPQVHVLLSRMNPEHFLKEACKVIRKGRGFPAMFNAEALIEQQLRVGKTISDARGGGICGCVETTCYGKEAAPLIGYINIAKILELALQNGYDTRVDKQVGPKSGDAKDFKSYEALMEAFKKQAQYVIDTKLRGSQYLIQMFAKYVPQPFLSVLIEGCVESGKDYNDGGPKYNVSILPGVGIGTVTDSLSAIKKHVFDENNYSMGEVIDALNADWQNNEHMRLTFANKTPRYGNDNDYADSIMKEVSDFFIDTVDGIKDSRGGTYRMNMLPTTCHMYFGEVTGATCDGRRAGKPLSEGISPVQGADLSGPTASLKSAAKMDHSRTCGTLLNMKFLPDVLKGDTGISKLASLIRTYFTYGGHHIQFNVCDADTLLLAQQTPDDYNDLIVRVAGYSDYFNVIGENLQNEIIQRYAHEI
ncbi:formate C-acetyltransferase [Desulfocicer vacuolatum DSM 3385]|uniref:Formate C-acetyltransferase n=1 Tax=Desulfocicer vacuolatum DSM 3385 TaxID=1121400 RepID=A0A1W2EUN5_9BACT|nr:pyruvate formate lyase family protein [Desulfocicer vacuolatum]SMD13292.1 formate C-acetyltransferase [Desulfocicer vacuolatum DSM 3385]